MIMNYYYRMSINLPIIWQKHWIHKKNQEKITPYLLGRGEGDE